ncbi:hypothetical protein SVIOM342S_02041 [Streptomyces violaceorubidus]
MHVRWARATWRRWPRPVRCGPATGERTGRELSAREVAEAALGGSPTPWAVYAAAGAGVARAIVMTAGLVDITTVVIGEASAAPGRCSNH